MRNIFRRPRYYWVMGRIEDQNFLNGPHATEKDADQWGYLHLDQEEYEVLELPTKDTRRANQIVRQRNVAAGQDVGQALERTKHKFGGGR